MVAIREQKGEQLCGASKRCIPIQGLEDRFAGEPAPAAQIEHAPAFLRFVFKPMEFRDELPVLQRIEFLDRLDQKLPVHPRLPQEAAVQGEGGVQLRAGFQALAYHGHAGGNPAAGPHVQLLAQRQAGCIHRQAV